LDRYYTVGEPGPPFLPPHNCFRLLAL
jgi:hypothetical protein